MFAMIPLALYFKGMQTPNYKQDQVIYAFYIGTKRLGGLIFKNLVDSFLGTLKVNTFSFFSRHHEKIYLL